MNGVKFSYSRTLALGVFIMILTGAVILSMPIATRDGNPTPFIDCLFTAASGTCVTGLVVYDTFSYWSVFGQVVILILVQIGGLGFMTMAVVYDLLRRRKIGLKKRRLMSEAVSSPQIGGIVSLTTFIIKTTLLFEIMGAVLLAIRFIPKLGFIRGIYYGIFHSVSAFCNAGFDLMGRYSQFSSLVSFNDDPLIDLTIMALIVAGGLGFYVWRDINKNRFHFKKYTLHSKMVLTTTALLILIPFLLVFFIERTNGIFKDEALGSSLLSTLFQVITTRTAGFNTVNLSQMCESSLAIFMLLMLIGGSPGSTAGGIKTTTFAVFSLSITSVIRKRKDIEVYQRRLESDLLEKVCTIIAAYMSLFVLATIAICAIEGLPMREVSFEVLSALGTVGLSLGITPTLETSSKLILIFLMYFGRVGCLTIVFALTERIHSVALKAPLEKISVG